MKPGLVKIPKSSELSGFCGDGFSILCPVRGPLFVFFFFLLNYRKVLKLVKKKDLDNT